VQTRTRGAFSQKFPRHDFFSKGGLPWTQQDRRNVSKEKCLAWISIQKQSQLARANRAGEQAGKAFLKKTGGGVDSRVFKRNKTMIYFF